MELHLVSRRYQKKYLISWITITTESGSLVIQANHAPLIASLAEKAECSFLIDNDTIETLLIQKGIIEVTRNRVMLLIHEE
jgi:F0F1-type ATP synthase epsilon subunit